MADRAAVRNRAILWLLYDTGIRVSELCGLRLGDFDRRHGVITVRGKARRNGASRLATTACAISCTTWIAIDRARRNWRNGAAQVRITCFSRRRAHRSPRMAWSMLFSRLRKRAGITDKRISPHILRHTFAVRYLVLGNDPFSLQELLGHEDMTTVKNYMHMNDTTIQDQKRKYSPGDHLPTRMPGPREIRRKGYRTRGQGEEARVNECDTAALCYSSSRESALSEGQSQATRTSSQSVNSTSLSWRGCSERSNGSLTTI